MKKTVFILFFISFNINAWSQKVDSIYFNLYTDSLKKGFYNYINLDGITNKGRWIPLTSTDLNFTSSAGRFEGNELFIDSSYQLDSVVIKAELKSNPAVWKVITVYIRKRGFDEPLKNDDEIFDAMKKEKIKMKTKSKSG